MYGVIFRWDDNKISIFDIPPIFWSFPIFSYFLLKILCKKGFLEQNSGRKLHIKWSNDFYYK